VQTKEESLVSLPGILLLREENMNVETFGDRVADAIQRQVTDSIVICNYATVRNVMEVSVYFTIKGDNKRFDYEFSLAPYDGRIYQHADVLAETERILSAFHLEVDAR